MNNISAPSLKIKQWTVWSLKTGHPSRAKSSLHSAGSLIAHTITDIMAETWVRTLADTIIKKFVCTIMCWVDKYCVCGTICIIIIIIFLHWLGRWNSSGIDTLPSFPRASTISSSSRSVVEGVFRESGVVPSFKMAHQVFFFVCGCLYLTSCIPKISSFFLMTSLLVLSCLVYPLTLLRKRISAASRRVMSRVVVTHNPLP